MKISIALAALILIVGAAFGWRDHQRVQTLRAEHQSLITEAAALGISVDLSNPQTGPRVTRREREDRNEETRRLVAEVIAIAKEMQQVEKSGAEPDKDTQKRGMDLMNKLMDLHPSQIKAFIAGLRAAEDLDDEMRQGLIGFSIMMLADSSPSTALAIFSESSDLLEESPFGSHVITSALTRWAQEDPMAALEWIRKNSEKHPDLVTEDAKQGILTGAAKNDPKLAFQLISELKFKDSATAIAAMGRAATTPESRTAILEAMRGYLVGAAGKDAARKIEQGLLGSMASSLRGQDFAQTAGWLDGVGLSSDETEAFAQGLHYYNTQKDSGQWIGWIAENAAPETMERQIGQIVRNWTREDFHAAGTWLAQAPDDAAKIPAVKAYVEAIAGYEPETAEQWALTLPAGKDRTSTLKAIHNSWPRDDPDGKSAFAEKHGLLEPGQ